jgi:COP9 signalosome complex subunit 2
MSMLRGALEANDLDKFESTLRRKENRIADDLFLMQYIAPLRRQMRERVLLNMIKPFSRVTVTYLANELSLNVDEVDNLVADLILDGRLNAVSDQLEGCVRIYQNSGLDTQGGANYADAMVNVIEAMNSIVSNLKSI